jgi:hypothetical protein
LGSDAFNGCGKNKIINIILPLNLSGYSKGCFNNYAIGNINTVSYVNNGGAVDSSILSELGITASNPTTIE